MYVFDASASAYAGNTTTGTAGGYSLSLASGTYKLWIQTNTAGYPDQAYGPDGTFENATPIDLTSTDQTVDVVLVAAATTRTISGTVTAAGTGVSGASCMSSTRAPRRTPGTPRRAPPGATA